MDGSGDAGFIFVSFGTIAPEEKMPAYAKRAFIEAFARIPQRVLWRFKQPLEGLSPNIKLAGWVPQETILSELSVSHYNIASV